MAQDRKVVLASGCAERGGTHADSLHDPWQKCASRSFTLCVPLLPSRPLNTLLVFVSFGRGAVAGQWLRLGDHEAADHVSLLRLRLHDHDPEGPQHLN